MPKKITPDTPIDALDIGIGNLYYQWTQALQQFKEDYASAGLSYSQITEDLGDLIKKINRLRRQFQDAKNNGQFKKYYNKKKPARKQADNVIVGKFFIDLGELHDAYWNTAAEQGDTELHDIDNDEEVQDWIDNEATSGSMFADDIMLEYSEWAEGELRGMVSNVEIGKLDLDSNNIGTADIEFTASPEFSTSDDLDEIREAILDLPDFDVHGFNGRSVNMGVELD